MDLQRPPEPFHRVYSPPEPPATTRRHRLVTVLLAVTGLGATAAGLFFLLSDGPSRTAQPSQRRQPASAPPSVSQGTTASPPAAPMFNRLPPPCASVSAATVQRLVPAAKTTESSNSTFGSCAYASSGQDFRWLRVDSRLYGSRDAATSVTDARRLFGVQWSLASRTTEERTVSLSRQGGLGDEAYRWFKLDTHQPTSIGVVAVRLRNVVITVSYSEQAVSKNGLPAQEQRCLTQATAVVREVLTGLR